MGSGTDDEFWRWPATQIARAVAAGQVSAREVTESCLARIDAVNPGLNALVEVQAEESLRAEAYRLWWRPAGVQLAGRRFDEDGILDAAGVIEARAGVFTPIDPR